MPKHNKDKQYISASEWKNEYGGKKTVRESSGARPLPFDCCAMSLMPFETPVCTRDGVIFDILEVMPYVKKNRRNPVDGSPLAPKDLIRLNFQKNGDGKWHCPVTFKVFTANSRIMAIATSGNVYAAEAVEELNLKAHNFTDLVTGEPFARADVIKLLDPTDAALMARRDIANFVHLAEAREAAAADAASTASTANIRRTATTDKIFDAIAEKRKKDAEAAAAAAAAAEAAAAERAAALEAEGAPLWKKRKVLLDDLVEGNATTTGAASGAFTSSSMTVVTSNAAREATEMEVNEARWKRLQKLKKKAYAQLQTSHGNINLELHTDITPRTAENFLQLCNKGYYDGTVFHRSIRNFMVQGGDPTGTGRGGDSFFGGPFKDECDNRLSHSGRGILSMANSGKDTNKSQFFLTYKSCPHLDFKHTVFGRVVGGLNALAAIEAVPVDSKDRPKTEIMLNKAVVFVNPIEEMEKLLEQELLDKIAAREAKDKAKAEAAGGRGGGSGSANSDAGRVGWGSNPQPAAAASSEVGKYLQAAAATTLPALQVAPSAAAAAAAARGGPLDFREEADGQRKRKAASQQPSFGSFSGW